MSDDTPSPLNNVITIDDERIKSHLDRVVRGTVEETLNALPDIPAVGEIVPSYEASQLYGIGAPRKTPAEIVDKLNKEINAVLGDSKAKARLADLGGTVIAGSPSDFGSFVAAETEKWAKVVRFAGIKPE